MNTNEIATQNEIRKHKGEEIANTCRILHRDKGGYVVPSQSGDGAYIVSYQDFKPVCECPDFEKRGCLGIKCKHIWSVEITLNKKTHPDGTVEIQYFRKPICCSIYVWFREPDRGQEINSKFTRMDSFS